MRVLTAKRVRAEDAVWWKPWTWKYNLIIWDLDEPPPEGLW
jgi:hypothetical protein